MLSTFSRCLPDDVTSLASLNKATGPKLTKLIWSPSAYLVSSFLRTSNSNDMYEFCKQIYASSLGKMMEIFELLLIVAKLLGEYSIKFQ